MTWLIGLIPTNTYNLSNRKLFEIRMLLTYLRVNHDFQDIKNHLSLKADSLSDYTLNIFKGKTSVINPIKVFLSDQDLLSFVYSINIFKRKIKDRLIKKATYPIILLGLSYALLFFYIRWVGPQLLNMMTQDLAKLEASHLLLLLRSLWLILSVIVGIMVIVGLLALNKRLRYQLVQIFSKWRFFSFFKRWISYHFAYCFNLLNKKGMTTKEILETMSTLGPSYFNRVLSGQVHRQLVEGLPFDQALKKTILDKDLFIFIDLNQYQEQASLDDYLLLVQDILDQKVDQFSRNLSLLSYVLIGFLVFCLSQMMLLPLKEILI